MGLLEGIRVVRSSDPGFPPARRARSPDFYVDVPYEGEIVRARVVGDGASELHEGGEQYVTLPPADFSREQVSPTRDTRLRGCSRWSTAPTTLRAPANRPTCAQADAPEISYVARDAIERADEAYTEFPA